MSEWEKKKILVTVKAYPEKSRKHGPVVCVSGITDEGEWIRLYPFQIHHFSGPNKIKKYDWIEIECKKASEKLNRKESYKIRAESVRIIDRSLHEKKIKGRVDWGARNEIILPHVDPSLEYLKERFDEDRTSLGLIKPKEVLEFYKKGELEIIKTEKQFQKTLFGPSIPTIHRIPHIFGYRFRCGGCEDGKEHKLQCEDWELLESYRSWGQHYRNVDILWEKLHEKFFEKMLAEKDLYFYVGMFSQYPTWLIIGLYYPPKGTGVS